MLIGFSTEIAIAIEAVLLALTSLLVIYCAFDKRSYPESTPLFLLLLVAFLWVEIAVDLVSYILDIYHYNATVKYVLYHIAYLFSTLVPWALVRGIIERGDSKNAKAIARVCDVLMIATNLVVVCGAPFNLIVAGVTNESSTAGPLYPILFICPLILSLIGIVMAFKIRTYPFLWRFSTVFIVATSFATAFLNPLLLHIPMTVIAETLGVTGIVLTSRSSVVGENAMRIAELATAQAELAEEKNATLVSQIKPHFVQNSLLAIAYLCEEDPAQAKKLTLDFARYLRGNIDSINGADLIPFKKELNHAQTYLAIERARFGDKFQVIYDIQEEDFLIPPLSIQPLVENAFKHGISPLPSGGTIWIATERVGDRYRVTVRDNGVGFDPEAEPESSKSHVGVSNTRNRISRLLGGVLNVSTGTMMGTEVTIEIPVQPKQEANR